MSSCTHCHGVPIVVAIITAPSYEFDKHGKHVVRIKSAQPIVVPCPSCGNALPFEPEDAAPGANE